MGNSGAGYNDLTGYKFALIRAQATMYELHQEMTAAGDIDGAARAQLAHHLVGLLLLVETRLQGRWALSMALSLGVRLGRLLG